MFNRVEFGDDGSFEHIFFAHGLGYFHDSAEKTVNKLEKGEKLFLCLDLQNEFDKDAVLIRADKPKDIIGYCPRYLAKNISMLVRDDPYSVEIFVEALSEDAPANYKLLCRIKGQVNVNSELASLFMFGEEYKPLNSNSAF